MKHVELEQFLHAFTSRGFDSVSWAFLYVHGIVVSWILGCVNRPDVAVCHTYY